MSRRLLKVTAYGALVLGVLLMALAIAGGVAWKYYADPANVQKAVKQQIGRHTKVEETHLRWASLSPGLRLSMEGLSLRLPGSERPVMESEELIIQFDRGQFVGGEMIPRQVRLIRPRIAFRRDPATGRWNVEDLLHRDALGQRRGPPPAGLLAEGLWVEDASVAVRSWKIFKSPLTRRLDGLNLHVWRDYEHDSLWNVSGSFARGLLRGASLRGWLNGSGFQMHLSMGDLDVDEGLLEVIPVGAPIEELFHPRGRIEGSVTLSMGPNDKEPNYNGRIDLRGLTSRTKFYDATMRDVAGRILIVGGKVLFRNVTAELSPDEVGLEKHSLHPASVRIDGTYTMDPESVHMQLNATGFPVTPVSVRAIPKIGDKVWKALQPDGFADFSLSVEDLPGKETKPTFKTILNLRDAGIRTEKLPFDLEQLVGTVEIDDDRVRLRDVRGVITQPERTPQIAVRGVFDTEGNPLDLTVEVTNLRTDEELVRGIPELGDDLWETFRPVGVLNASCTIRRGNTGRPEVSGSIHLYDATVRSKFSALPVHNVAANIRFDDERIQIARLSGRIGLGAQRDHGTPPGRLLLTGEVSRNLETGSLDVQIPVLQLTRPVVEALPEFGKVLWQHLQPEGLVALRGRIAFDRKKENPLSYLLDMELKNSRATWQGFRATMSSLNGTVLMDERNIFVPNLTGNIAGGPFNISGFVTRGEQGTTRYNGTIEYRRLDLRRLIYELTEEETRARGRLSGLVELGGRTGEDPRLHGMGTAELSEGQVWKSPVLLGLVDVLHLTAPGEHGRFDRGTMRFSFDSKKLDLHSFRLTSPAAELTGQGQMGLEDGALDLSMVAATLPQGGLPVIGQALRTVLRPVERQLVRIRVQGTIQDPIYKPQPFQEVTRPISSLFDLLTSPFRGEKKDQDDE
jgi:hypothetical protein